MKKFTFKLVVEEGSDEFWENMEGTGCDEVEALVLEALAAVGLYTDTNCELELTKYTNTTTDEE